MAKEKESTEHIGLDHMTVKHIESGLKQGVVSTGGGDDKNATLTTGHLNPKGTPSQSGETGNSSGSGSGGSSSSGS